MPSFAARRTVLATREDVWRFLAEPANLADWWPGILAVRADRQGLVPGARWHLVAPPSRGAYMRRPQAEGRLLVLEVEPLERLTFQVTSDRIDAELRILAVDADRTDVELTVEGPWLIGLSRRFPQQALHRLSSRVAAVASD